MENRAYEYMDQRERRRGGRGKRGEGRGGERENMTIDVRKEEERTKE